MKEQVINRHDDKSRMPHTDGREAWDIVIGLHAYPAVLLAHELKLFGLLAEAPIPIATIAERLGLSQRAAGTLLSLCTSLGLIGMADDRYGLTPVAAEYLLESSPTSFCGYLDLMIANAASFSYEGIKASILRDTTQVYDGQDIFEVHQQDDEMARAFTRAMHSASVAPALAWPAAIDLSRHRHMLDIGGGSGVHCIGAVKRWPHFSATVFDLAPICTVAEEFITREGLGGRIRTAAGNMWKTPFPEADVHFYSLIYHDWSPEQCAILTRKSFESLLPGGLLIVHEWLFNDEHTGPLSTAAYNLIMLLWCASGRQYAGREISGLMREAGFVDIEVKPTIGYWSVVVGRKPG